MEDWCHVSSSWRILNVHGVCCRLYRYFILYSPLAVMWSVWLLHTCQQVRALRALFVLVLAGIYAITLSAVALEQLVGTTNGRDPHPWVYFRYM